MELTGKIIEVGELVTGRGKKGPWHKLPFVIETEGQYPKKIALSLWDEKKINDYDLEVGLKITASIDIESRFHNGNWFTDIRAWKITWTERDRKWQPGGQGSGKPKDKPF